MIQGGTIPKPNNSLNLLITMARRKAIKLPNLFKPKKKKTSALGSIVKSLCKGMKEVEKRPYGRMGWW